MYRKINEYKDFLIEAFSTKHFTEYLALKDISQSSSKEYQKLYCKFYALNAAHLGDSFKDAYFKVLSSKSINGCTTFNICDLCNYFYEIASNNNGTKSLQFSFSTKLLHTLDDTLPIYDKQIAKFYYFPEVKTDWKIDKRIAEYKKDYDFLIYEYKRILDNKLLEEVISTLKNKFPITQNISDIKIIDFIIWNYTNLLTNGFIRDKKIKYE